MRYESESEFRRDVEKKIGEVDDADWAAVALSFPPYDDADLGDVLSALRKRGYDRPRRKKRRVTMHGAIVRGIAAENTWENPLANIRGFRTRYFGALDPPFTTIGEAAKWIEAQEGDSVSYVCVDPDRLSDAEWKAFREGDYRSLPRPVKHQKPSLQYLDEGAGIVRTVKVKRGALEALYRVSNRLVQFWEVPQWQAVARILTGEHSYREPINVTTTPFPHPKVVITVTDPAVTEEQVGDAFIEARNEVWDVRRGRALSERDAALVLFVTENHDLTWWDMRARWGRHHPEWKFATTEAMRKRYERAKDKIL